MVIYDGIIESLQNNGGITIVFNELISRMNDFKYFCYNNSSNITNKSEVIKSRLLERYLDVDISQFISNGNVFHSTYYRLCSNEVPTVTTVHDFTYEKYIKGPAKWIHMWQKNRAIKGSDKIICISENTANDLLRYCSIDESKITIIYNGVSEDYHQLKQVSPHSNEVIFVGARSEYKNFLKAIDVIALCPELSLSIVGGGELNQQELFYLNNKLLNRYKWFGQISNRELNSLYNRAHCLLYPSSYEGFGIPIIESMRAGCPVVAMNMSSIPEVAGTAALLIDKLDVNILAEAVKTLSCLTERNKYIQSGLKNSQKFSWERCHNETNKIYQSLS